MTAKAGKSEIQAGRLETQTGADVVVLSPKFTGQAGSLETQTEFVCCSLEGELLFLRETDFCQ